MATGSSLCAHDVYGHHTEIERCWCGCRAVSPISPWKSYEVSVDSVKKLRGDGAVTMRSLCKGYTIVTRAYDDHTIFVLP